MDCRHVGTKLSDIQTISAEDIKTDAVIKQLCEKCGREEVRFYTQQIRSADEGTTVFYTCECGHRQVSVWTWLLQVFILMVQHRWNTNN
jgi:DNA-directed RNA polymerase subunit M/transcription elongation factor TFIIS